MYFCIRLAGRRISMLFITKGSTSHTVGGKNCMKQVLFVFSDEMKWIQRQYVLTKKLPEAVDRSLQIL